MLSYFGPSSAASGQRARRELIRVGGLGTLGLALADLLAARVGAGAAGATPTEGVNRNGPTFGRAKNVIFLWLQGGPPQHETFDPKPDAPAEIRGEFAPIDTTVPGIQFSELLPRTARIAHHLAVVRSIATDSDQHEASGYHVLTGRPYAGTNPRQISPSDWPYFGSLVRVLRPSPVLPAYTTVWLPDVMRLNEGVKPAGQTAGFLGKTWEPERIICDPLAHGAPAETFSLLPELDPLRLDSRAKLLDQVDRQFASLERSESLAAHAQRVREAFDVLTTGRARAAFDLEREPGRLRERYGLTQWGQSVLLARRLVEAGVRLVHVNWTREPGDNAVDNPMWDTHAQNADRLQDVLCPQFDVGFSALIEDLEDRGLLCETLVVAIGEFGRTPRINAHAGRDHWGHVFSFALAGAGIRAAQVLGESDKIGGYPKSDKVTPEQLAATIFHLLGVDQEATFLDRAGRPFPVMAAPPIHRLLGTEPTTTARRAAGGDVASVPLFTSELLLDPSFASEAPLLPADAPRRAKGWRADPLPMSKPVTGLAVRRCHADPTHPKPFVALGLGLASDPTPLARVVVPEGAAMMLAQEIKNPRSGHFALTARVWGEGKDFDEVFAGQFSFRLLLFQFADKRKNPTKYRELAGMDLSLARAPGTEPRREKFTLEAYLGSAKPGANFAIGTGLGVALVARRTAPGAFEWNPEPDATPAFLAVDSIVLEFVGKKRDDNVVV